MGKASRLKKQRRLEHEQHSKNNKTSRLKKTIRSILKSAWLWVFIAVSSLAAIGINRYLHPRPVQGWPDPLIRGSLANFNVMVITLDTTRADRLGCYEYAQAETPYLDGLAAGGIRFTNVTATSPITLPSHCSIFTGLFPPNHGARDNSNYRLADHHITLAEMFQDKDYETAAFISAFVLESRFGLIQGFELYDDAITEGSVTRANLVNERNAKDITNRAIEWLVNRSRDRRFFCWLHYFDPHNPYAPPDPWSEKFKNRLYDGEIAFMDYQIGRLLKSLQDNGYRDNTLIIAVADHGESLGEHDEETHVMLIYEATMRVPLIISCPGLFEKPHVVNRLVSITDIFPTLLELADIDIPAPNDGISFLSGNADPDRLVYIETFGPHQNGWLPLFGLRSPASKYIKGPPPEYYDLVRDPHELHNIHDEISGADREKMETMTASLSMKLDGWPGIAEVAAGVQKIDPDTELKLKALGYLADDGMKNAGTGLPHPRDMLWVLKEIDRTKAYLRSGKGNEALRIIENIRRRIPANNKVLETLGTVLYAMGNRTGAEKAFREAFSIHPDVELCLHLIKIQVMDKRFNDAREWIAIAESINPDHGGIYLAEGDIFFQEGNYDDALMSYEHAKRVDPNRFTEKANMMIYQVVKKKLGLKKDGE
ncbi:sulfatase-like hydrolase/transferase [bacterium]|nr:sulfatase-like hydrolase/transferase [candidate division CSSED10-310 bacterium]